VKDRRAIFRHDDDRMRFLKRSWYPLGVLAYRKTSIPSDVPVEHDLRAVVIHLDDRITPAKI
jgi:hypothetical protein